MIPGKPVAFVYVRDLKRALAFYLDALGLEVRETDDYGASLAAGPGLLRLTVMADHKPHEHPVFGLHVDDFSGAFEALSGRGVRFTVYDGMTDARGVCKGSDGKSMAWFADPDGNALMLSEG
jgi:catechol 2,3-dioxygenase-like lactoylglutathione lyase family enzyme